MPIDYDFDALNGILTVRMKGIVGDDDLIGYAEAITRDDAIDPKHDELIDLRELARPAASTDTLRHVASIFRDHERQPEAVRVAFVAASDAAFGLARMYQAFRAESRTALQVFRDVNEAREWLGLEPEPE
jgi:hypothetical protein